jgi:hypothetical protein
MTTDEVAGPAATPPPPGWYDDGSGRQRWFDGTKWTEQYQATQATHTAGPMTSASLNVKREVSYVRQQKGHSLTKHLLLGWIVLWIPTIYYAVSPNHYFHA